MKEREREKVKISFFTNDGGKGGRGGM